jgi:hypothetical protein
LAGIEGTVSAVACPVPAAPKAKCAEYSLNTFGARVLDSLWAATVHARPAAQSICVRLTADYLDLDSTQQLLAFL